MRSKRILMGAAVIGCMAAAMTSGAYAQEANTNQQLNARSGQQPAASARTSGSIRQGQSGGANAQLDARTNGNATTANGQFERRGVANESRMGTQRRMGAENRMGAERRMGATAHEGRNFAEHHALRGERGYAHVSEQRYGRGWRGERGLYARAGVDGYREGRVGYRERVVGTGVGVAAADYGYRGGYRGRRLYAYAPGYETGVATAPRYSYAAAPRYSYSYSYSPGYAPGYDIGLNTGPYYAPAWNTAYAGPYYDYAPGFSVGIGIGPVGIGIGPAWGW